MRWLVVGSVIALAFLSLLTARGIVTHAPDITSAPQITQAKELRSSGGHSGQISVPLIMAVVAAGIVFWRERAVENT